MWCDNFDMDLPKVIPEAAELLADIGSVSLQTHGNKRDGKLDHPAVWNSYHGMVAFFGLHSPSKPEGYVTSDPVVTCTFWEAVRDAWPHQVLIIVEGKSIWNAWLLAPQFQEILYALRGWHKDANPAEVAASKAFVLETLRDARVRFKVVMEAYYDRYPALRRQDHVAL